MVYLVRLKRIVRWFESSSGHLLLKQKLFVVHVMGIGRPDELKPRCMSVRVAPWTLVTPSRDNRYVEEADEEKENQKAQVKAHSNDYYAARFGEPQFKIRTNLKQMDGSPEPAKEFPQCSYCGSIDVASVIAVLQRSGTHYSGSDWKYGWPHKFYLDVPCEPYRFCSSKRSGGGQEPEYGYSTKAKEHFKFYSEHLRDATPEELEQFNAVARKTVGITFEIKDDKLFFSAPYGGFQAWGDVK